MHGNRDGVPFVLQQCHLLLPVVADEQPIAVTFFRK
jgi:hypothetical protein